MVKLKPNMTRVCKTCRKILRHIKEGRRTDSFCNTNCYNQYYYELKKTIGHKKRDLKILEAEMESLSRQD